MAFNAVTSNLVGQPAEWKLFQWKRFHTHHTTAKTSQFDSIATTGFIFVVFQYVFQLLAR